MRVILDTPTPIEKLRKTYNDKVTFITTTQDYPLITEIEMLGNYLGGMRKRLVPVRVGKKVDKLIARYAKRLNRIWNQYQKELVNTLSLEGLKKLAPENEVEKADAPTLAQVLSETDPTRQQVLHMKYLKARREKLIKPKLEQMKQELQRAAKPMFESAYLLGKERGQILTQQEMDDDLNDEDEELLAEKEDTNEEFVAILVADTYDDYEEALGGEYETEAELMAGLRDAHKSQQTRLGSFAATLGAALLAAGMSQAIRDIQEVDADGEPTGEVKTDPETGEPLGEVVEGGYWHTRTDERVCEGCEGNDGAWMTLEDFQEEANTNECLSNCRCIELFEPAPMPTDQGEVWTGTPGIDKMVQLFDLIKHSPHGISKHLPGKHDQAEHSPTGAPAKEKPAATPTTDAPTVAETKPAESGFLSEERFNPSFVQSAKAETENAKKYLEVKEPISREAIAEGFNRHLNRAFEEKIASYRGVVANRREIVNQRTVALAADKAKLETATDENRGLLESELHFAEQNLAEDKVRLRNSENTLTFLESEVGRVGVQGIVDKAIEELSKAKSIGEQKDLMRRIHQTAVAATGKAWRAKGEKAELQRELTDTYYSIVRNRNAQFQTYEEDSLKGYMESHNASIIQATSEEGDATYKHTRRMVEGDATKTIQGRPNFKEGRDWILNNFNPAVLASMTTPVKWEAKRGAGGGRSWYRSADQTITLARDDRPGTIPHEFVHHLERQVPEISSFFEDYYAQRTGTEQPVKMSKIRGHGGYESYEYTRPDKFADAYMGHVNIMAYGSENRRGGEIFSQAVAMLSTPQDAARLYRKDPELFGITMSVLKGNVPHRTTHRAVSG
jgi:hypothetical protein